MTHISLVENGRSNPLVFSFLLQFRGRPADDGDQSVCLGNNHRIKHVRNGMKMTMMPKKATWKKNDVFCWDLHVSFQSQVISSWNPGRFTTVRSKQMLIAFLAFSSHFSKLNPAKPATSVLKPATSVSIVAKSNPPVRLTFLRSFMDLWQAGTVMVRKLFHSNIMQYILLAYWYHIIL